MSLSFFAANSGKLTTTNRVESYGIDEGTAEFYSSILDQLKKMEHQSLPMTSGLPQSPFNKVCQFIQKTSTLTRLRDCCLGDLINVAQVNGMDSAPTQRHRDVPKWKRNNHLTESIVAWIYASNHHQLSTPTDPCLEFSKRGFFYALTMASFCSK
jgi:hypothetical protein